MSGILGIWNLDGRPVDRRLLSKLAAVQGHRNADGEGVWIEDNVGLLFQNLWVTPESIGETQPIVRRSENVVMFDGRLDNREELLPLLKGSVSSESSDAAFVSAVHAKFGEAFPEKLLGDFAIAVYDIRERKLLLARDGIGVRPIYYTRAGASFVIASECKPILAHPQATNKPNPDMIAAYFLACMGHDRGGWTFFQDVYSVVPGQLVVIKPNSVAKRIYWDFPQAKTIRLGSFEEYADAFREQFDRAVARRLRSVYPVSVALSGGLDSSSIFCAGETMRRRGDVNCPGIRGIYVAHQGPLADELVFVEDIEREFDVNVRRVRFDSSRFITGSVRKGLRVMEAPHIRSQADYRFPLEQEARRLGARTLITGHWADQFLANRSYLIDLFRGGRWIAVSRHLREQSRYYQTTDAGWFRKVFYHDLLRYHIPVSWMPAIREVRKRLTGDRSWFTPNLWKRARHVENLQAFRSQGRTAQQSSMYALVRPMYYVQGMERCAHVGACHQMDYAYPFLDRDLVRFLMTVPGDVICRNGVPKALLRAGMAGTLPVSIAERNWKAETSTAFNSAVDRDLPAYASCLQEDAMAVALGFLDGQRLSQASEILRSQLHDDECLSTKKLTDLIGLELWLQAFFANKSMDNMEEYRKHVGQPA
jgi:asparagine synthase (glutamine-hydrolysing)